jgi:biotin operon repressor
MQSDHGTFHDLATRRDARLQRRRQELAQWESRRRPAVVTRLRLDRAAYGVGSSPIGCTRTERVEIDTLTWAGLIHSASRAFARCPGLEALEKRPLPDVGFGIEAGIRILRLAASGASREAVTQALHEARQALGAWEERGDRGGLSPADTETGIWILFKQLHRYWTGSRWEPPLRRPAKAKVLNGDNPSTPRPRASQKKAKPLFSQRQEQVLDALRAKPMTQKELASMFLGDPLRTSTVGSWIHRLRKMGVDIRSDRGHGYWLPENPPTQG